MCNMRVILPFMVVRNPLVRILGLGEGVVGQVLGLLVAGLSIEGAGSLPRSVGSDLGMVVLSGDLVDKREEMLTLALRFCKYPANSPSCTAGRWPNRWR